ncbi:MAG: hypothetical protein KatS3mg035_1598 [Bacteroidia bacterium]|nr:MAG: hypothetical protein KatS3mg035_1598 [Bacteroidia bacterium]
MRRFLLVIVLIIFVKTLNAQFFNYSALNKKNVLSVNVKMTPNITYARLLNDTLKKAKILGISLNHLPENFYNNNGLYYSQAIFYNQVLFNKNYFNLSFNYKIINYRSSNNHFTEAGLSQVLSLTSGYYKKNYFIALNLGIGNNTYYSIKFKDVYYENLYNKKSQQGISSNIFPSIALLGGISYKRFDFILRTSSDFNQKIIISPYIHINFKF